MIKGPKKNSMLLMLISAVLALVVAPVSARAVENGWCDAAGNHTDDPLQAVAWYEYGEPVRSHAFYDPGTDAWYWADEDTSIATGKDVFIPRNESNRDEGGKWVRFDSNRRMIKGEHYSSVYNGWYYFDLITGEMWKGVHFISSDGGKWVYYDWTTGKMSHGEAYIKDQGHDGWYLFDNITGAMHHGFKYLPSDGGKWVYYDAVTGVMVKGEAFVGDGWCYFDPVTGATTYGWCNLPDGRTVFYDTVTGRMKYGWQTIDGMNYYFNEVSGNLEQRGSLNSGSDTGSVEQGGNAGSDGVNLTTVYWTDGGERYHSRTSCPSLSRSRNIRSGSLDDAIRAGKDGPCKDCI